MSTIAVPKSRLSSRRSSRIWAWMVTSSAVVGSSAMSSTGSLRHAHGEHDALAHAARELVRVAVDGALRRVDAHPAEHLHGPVGRLIAGVVAVHHHGLDELAGDAQHRVERGHRVLEDHRHAAAAQVAHLLRVGAEDVAALEADLAADDAARLLEKPHQRKRGDALAGARFADDAERLAGRDREADAVDRAHHALVGEELGLEVADLEDRASASPAAPGFTATFTGASISGRASRGCRRRGS